MAPETSVLATAPSSPGSSPDPSAAASDTPTLEEARKLLAEKAAELLSVGADRIRPLTIEVQKLRVYCLLKQEEVDQRPLEDTYREMSLLNRMLREGAGLDEDPEEAAEEEARLLSVSKRLETRGLKPELAARYIKILSSLDRAAALPLDGEDLDDDAGLDDE